MHDPTSFTRRRLIGGVAVAALSSAAAPALGAARRRSRGEKVNVAVIGAGGQGASNMSKLTGENIVACADVDYDHVLKALTDKEGNLLPARRPLKAAYDRAERFGDWRRMLDKRKDIDAVVIATPDHHHAVAARWAMERGLHVYVQKPLTYSVEESRLLAKLARGNAKLVTQMGNQGHSGDDGRRVVELVRSGILGPVREVHVWTNRPIWPQGVPRRSATFTPASLDWDSWLGPSDVDWGFHADYAHFNWRGWVPFGSGALGDMGAHLIDFPFWSLQLGLPTRIETRHTRWGADIRQVGATGPAGRAGFPLASTTHYQFGNAPGGLVRLTWHDGGLLPETPPGFPAGLKMDPMGGVLFVGSRGMLMHETYGEKPVLIGEGLDEAARSVPRTLPRIAGGMQGHEMNFVRAIRGEEAISCPFDYAAPLNEAMNLGIVAMKAEQPILYDGAAGRITNLPDANRYLARETYRKGWELTA